MCNSTYEAEHVSRRMKELPLSERPYEKCRSLGPSALSDAELLAVILKNGVPGMNATELATELLIMTEEKGGLAALTQVTEPELTRLRGIGTVKAVQLRCIGELARRIAMSQAKDSVRLTSPESIAAYFMEDLCHRTQEVVAAAFFNTKNRLLHSSVISTGTVNGSLVSAREIFMEALRYGAVSVVILHNHPSGDPAPSEDDIVLTRALKESGQLLSIPLMDHIIIGDHCYISLFEQGYL